MALEGKWKKTPDVVVFDLDGCVWYPEMYHLWGGGGSPFREVKSGDLLDKSGRSVALMGNGRAIFAELHESERWTNTAVAFASSTDEPSWANECIEKFRISQNVYLKDCVDFREIHKGNKKTHLSNIKRKFNLESFESILFFDNELGNCRSVAELGVSVVYTPNGLTGDAWTLAAQTFPSPGKVHKAK